MLRVFAKREKERERERERERQSCVFFLNKKIKILSKIKYCEKRELVRKCKKCLASEIFEKIH